MISNNAFLFVCLSVTLRKVELDKSGRRRRGLAILDVQEEVSNLTLLNMLKVAKDLLQF